MNDHYFSREPQSASRPVACEVDWRGQTLRFETDSGVFSRGEADPGSLLLLNALPQEGAGDVLDLGCGWGLMGIAVAKAWPACRATLTDVNLRALDLARENARKNGVTVRCLESDGLAALAGETFDLVITNPPIRAGKEVIWRLFAEAAAALRPGGSLYVVIRKQQGAESCLRYLKTLLDPVEKVARSGGYWVLKGAKA